MPGLVPGIYFLYLAEQWAVDGRDIGERSDAVLWTTMPGPAEKERQMAGNGAALHNPLGLLAELTHRCPLGCPYCSNPLALNKRAGELDSAPWARVLREPAVLCVWQVYL